ncbi:hypothetical protein TNCV_2237441 [Trichonephila clavipes]|nr:hypothetical protein TNCV_2237441 [Trichonephila clavipes]
MTNVVEHISQSPDPPYSISFSKWNAIHSADDKHSDCFPPSDEEGAKLVSKDSSPKNLSFLSRGSIPESVALNLFFNNNYISLHSLSLLRKVLVKSYSTTSMDGMKMSFKVKSKR